MKACLRSRDGSCIHQLRQPLTTIGCEGSDVIIQVSALTTRVRRAFFITHELLEKKFREKGSGEEEDIHVFAVNFCSICFQTKNLN